MLLFRPAGGAHAPFVEQSVIPPSPAWTTPRLRHRPTCGRDKRGLHLGWTQGAA